MTSLASLAFAIGTATLISGCPALTQPDPDPHLDRRTLQPVVPSVANAEVAPPPAAAGNVAKPR